MVKSLVHTVLAVFLSVCFLGDGAVAGLSPNCYRHGGRGTRVIPFLCYPAVQNVASLPSTIVTSSSTCRWNETYCQRSGHLASAGHAGGAVACSTCAAQPGRNTKLSSFPVFNAVDKNLDTFWQSSPLVVAQTKVIVRFQLQRPYVVFSVKLEFAEIGMPSLAVLEGSSDGGQSWIYMAEFRNNCKDVTSARVACHPINRDQRSITVEVLSKSQYIAAVEQKTLEELNRRSTFTDLRLVLLLNDGIVLDRHTTVRRRLAAFFFYRLADVSINAMCQCSGHASRCVTGASGSHIPQCRCTHGTTGEQCHMCSADASSTTYEVANKTILPSAAFKADKCEDVLSPANANRSLANTNRSLANTNRSLANTNRSLANTNRSLGFGIDPGTSTAPTILAPTTDLLTEAVTTYAPKTLTSVLPPTSAGSVANTDTTPEATSSSHLLSVSNATGFVTEPTASGVGHRTKTPTFTEEGASVNVTESPLANITDTNVSAVTKSVAADSTVSSATPTTLDQMTETTGGNSSTSFTVENNIQPTTTLTQYLPAVDGNDTLSSTPPVSSSSANENTTVNLPPALGERATTYTDNMLIYIGPAAGVALAIAMTLLVVQQHRYRKKSRSTFVPTKYSDRALKYDDPTFSSLVLPRSYQITDSSSSSSGSDTKQKQNSVVPNSEKALSTDEPNALTLTNTAAEATLSISSTSSGGDCEAVRALAAMTEVTGTTTVNPARALSTVNDNDCGQSSDGEQVGPERVPRRTSRTKSVPDQQRRSWAPDTTNTPMYVNLKRFQTAYQYNKAQQAQALQVQLASASLPRNANSPLPRNTSPLPLGLRSSNEPSLGMAPDQYSMGRGSITTTGTYDELFYACSDLDLNSSLMNCSLTSSPLEPEMMAALQQHRRHRRPPSRAHSLQGGKSGNHQNYNASASESERPPMPRARSRSKRSRSIHSQSPVAVRQRRHNSQKASMLTNRRASERQSAHALHGSDREHPMPRPRSRRSFRHDISSLEQQYLSDATSPFPGSCYPPPPDHVIDDILSIASSLSRRRTYLAEPHSPPKEPPAPPQSSSLPRNLKGSEGYLGARQSGDGECSDEPMDNVTVIDHGSEEEGDVPVLPSMMNVLDINGIARQNSGLHQTTAILRTCASSADDCLQGEGIHEGGLERQMKCANESTQEPIRYSQTTGLSEAAASLTASSGGRVHHERTAGGNLTVDGLYSPKSRSETVGDCDEEHQLSSAPSCGYASSPDCGTGQLNAGGNTSTLRTELHFDLTNDQTANAGSLDDAMHPESFIIHL